MKQILTPSKLAIITKLATITFFSMTSLFAAEERKRPNTTQPESIFVYDDALTKELMELCNSHRAFACWNQEIVERAETLIRLGADPNIMHNNTPLLIFACMKKNNSLIKTCLAYGARTNAVIPVKMPPLLPAHFREPLLHINNQASVLINRIKNNYNTIVGQHALHFVAGLNIDTVEKLCNSTPIDLILLDSDCYTPLHHLCRYANAINRQVFFQTAATLIWWSREQLNIPEAGKNKIPYDFVEENAPHLVDGFKAIFYDIQRAQSQLALLPPVPRMSLSTFNQFLYESAKNQLISFIGEKLNIKSISDLVMVYAEDRYTPFPVYPAIACRQGDDGSFLPNTNHIPQKKLLLKKENFILASINEKDCRIS